MIIDKDCKIDLVSSNDETRYLMVNPWLKNGHVYATDGRVMAKIKVEIEDEETEGAIPCEAFKAFRRANTGRKTAIIILNDKEVSVIGNGVKQSFNREYSAETNFPNCDQVIPPPDREGTIKLKINSDQLCRVAEALGAGGKLQAGCVTLEFKPNGDGNVADPIVVTLADVEDRIGVMMPMR